MILTRAGREGLPKHKITWLFGSRDSWIY